MLSASVTASVKSSDTRMTNGLVTVAFSPFHSVPCARLRMFPASAATFFRRAAMAAQSSAAAWSGESLMWRSSSKVGTGPPVVLGVVAVRSLGFPVRFGPLYPAQRWPSDDGPVRLRNGPSFGSRGG